LKGNTSGRLTRTGPHTRLSAMWRWMFLSVALDGAAAIFLGSALSALQAQIIATVCTLVTLPFLNQQVVAKRAASLRKWQSDSRTSGNRGFKVILGVSLAGIVVVKLLLLPSINTIAAVIVAAILLLGIVSSVQHVLRETRAQSKALLDSPRLHVALWERQLIVLFSIPIIAARIISLCGALSVGRATTPALNVIYLLVGIMLLAAMKPERSAFIGWCRRCRSPTPVAFVEYGSCPRCDDQLR
jgi:hypothetical protein